MSSDRLIELFESHHRSIYRFHLRMSGSREVAEDLTQETFARALRAFPSYTQRGRDESWLFQIARNLQVDRFRKESGEQLVEATAPRREGQTAATQDLRLSLNQALSRLAGPEREAFLLREIGGLRYQEIADLTDSTLGAVRNRIHRARTALKDMLAPRRLTRQATAETDATEVNL